MMEPSGAETLMSRVAAELARAARRAGSLAAEPIRFGSPKWFEETIRVYADPFRAVPGVGPYVDHRRTWCEIRARVTSGTVVLVLREGEGELKWWRVSKSWAEDFGVEVLADPQQGLQPFSFSHQPRFLSSWKVPGGRTYPTSCPRDVEALLPRGRTEGAATATTGAVVPLLRTTGPRPGTAALLCFAKSDTRFRRVGLWGLRRDLLAELTPRLADVLARGRAGVLRSGDLAS